MISSCKMRPTWWLPLTWLIGTRSASIMQSRVSNEVALQVLRKLLTVHHAHHAPRRRVHEDSLLGATSMKTVMDSVVGST